MHCSLSLSPSAKVVRPARPLFVLEFVDGTAVSSDEFEQIDVTVTGTTKASISLVSVELVRIMFNMI